MNSKGIYDSVSEKDIFLVNTTGNIAKPKIISKVFGITMRNLRIIVNSVCRHKISEDY